MPKITSLPLPLLGVLCFAGLTPAFAADPSLGEAIRTADAKYLEVPESGSIDESPKIVTGGGEEGLPPLDEDLALGPLRVTLTYAEMEPDTAAGATADDAPQNGEIAFEDIPAEAMLPGEFDLGETVSRVPVVTVYFDDPSLPPPAADGSATGSGAPSLPDDDGNGVPEAAADADPATAEVATGPQVVATLRGPDAGVSDPPVSIQIAELDPGNAHPEVVVSFFTGGAHCCSVTHVVTSSTDGSDWTTVHVGEFDGGPLLAVDLDGDGIYEFETRDNAFLYAFGCYACSLAPLQVLALRDGKIEDVGSEARFGPAHAAWLKNMILSVPDQDVNGFLAGYVGQKIRLGESQQAWDLMLKYYDRNSDWGLEVCDGDRDEGGECLGETTKVAFPDALERMLNKNGYKIGG